MRWFATSLILVLLAAPADAQCPDGRPQDQCAPRSQPHVDPNRIAVLPFRVTAADSLLGEGFAELLANEFQGDGGMRSIDMGSTIAAWRRAGGGLRSPLALTSARNVARTVGAGRVTDGSIVVLGNVMTVTASIVGTADGAMVGKQVKVSAPADSLSTLLNRTASSMLVAIGGSGAAETGVGLSDSTAAVREYMKGLNAWRRGHTQAAASAFDRAIEIDSSFARALYWRYMLTFWTAANPRSLGLAWAARTRMPLQQRAVLEAWLGANYPASRTNKQMLADLQRTAQRFPDSPDAVYFLGDWQYHYGASVSPSDHLLQAREYLGRAAAIDSQAPVLRHMVELALRIGDTVQLRRAWIALEKSGDDEVPCLRWVVAGQLGDSRMLAAARRNPDPVATVSCRQSVAVSAMPAALLDELIARTLRASTGAVRDAAINQLGQSLVVRGRPAAAEQLWAQTSEAGRATVHGTRITLAALDAGRGLDLAATIHRIDSLVAANGPDRVRAECNLRFFALVSAAGVPGLPQRDAVCTQPGYLLFNPLPNSRPGDGALEAADSLVHNLSVFTSGTEQRTVAGYWERRGRPVEALSAIRARQWAGPMHQATWRYEGWLALQAGDTAVAIHAFRTWLSMMRDAEPIWKPATDSVSAVLAVLERGRRP